MFCFKIQIKGFIETEVLGQKTKKKKRLRIMTSWFAEIFEIVYLILSGTVWEKLLSCNYFLSWKNFLSLIYIQVASTVFQMLQKMLTNINN